MIIGFMGHLSVDRNVIDEREHRLHGGGVLHGGVTARRLGAETHVYTMCLPEERNGFSILEQVGAETTFFSSSTGTSILNLYPDSDPDHRRSSLVSRARSFSAADLERVVDVDVLHINPLSVGEFPDPLLPAARNRSARLSGDAQGFLREVRPDGRLAHRNWAEKARYLPLFDYFKVDGEEARVLTGREEPAEAARALADLGVSVVVLTHRDGVCVFDGNRCFESPFSNYSLHGRTGRGDTCMAAFLVLDQQRADRGQAVAEAAEVTSRKMQYPGPFQG